MTLPLSAAGADVQRRMERLGDELSNSTADTVAAAAKVAVRVQEQEIRRVAGGDMRLSGAGGRSTRQRGGAKVGARVKRSTNPSNGVAETTVQATGPLHLVERSTSGRIITPLGVKGRSASGKRVGRKGQGTLLAGTFTFSGSRQQVLNIPGIGFRKYARHGGTRGQEPWEKGRKAAEPEVRRVIVEQINGTLEV